MSQKVAVEWKGRTVFRLCSEDGMRVSNLYCVDNELGWEPDRWYPSAEREMEIVQVFQREIGQLWIIRLSVVRSLVRQTILSLTCYEDNI